MIASKQSKGPLDCFLSVFCARAFAIFVHTPYVAWSLAKIEKSEQSNVC